MSFVEFSSQSIYRMGTVRLLIFLQNHRKAPKKLLSKKHCNHILIHNGFSYLPADASFPEIPFADFLLYHKTIASRFVAFTASGIAFHSPAVRTI